MARGLCHTFRSASAYGKGQVPDPCEVVAARNILRSQSGNEFQSLAFPAFDLLFAVVEIPKEDEVEVARVSHRARCKPSQGPRVRAPVARLLKEFPARPLLGRLPRLDVAAGDDPDARVLDRGDVVAQLQKGRAVAAQEHNARDDLPWARGRGGERISGTGAGHACFEKAATVCRSPLSRGVGTCEGKQDLMAAGSNARWVTAPFRGSDSIVAESPVRWITFRASSPNDTVSPLTRLSTPELPRVMAALARLTTSPM